MTHVEILDAARDHAGYKVDVTRGERIGRMSSGHASAVLGSMEIAGLTELSPCWRPPLQALTAHISVQWTAGPRSDPAWLDGKRKIYKPEEIIAKLCQVEVLTMTGVSFRVPLRGAAATFLQEVVSATSDASFQLSLRYLSLNRISSNI